MYEDKIGDLIGVVMSEVKNVDGEELLFTAENGDQWKFYHSQDCCENVRIEDVCGDLKDLEGSPILMAEEAISSEPFEGKPVSPESFIWTFYKFATKKGYVTIRWLGESNGYYSERVDFEKVKRKD